MIAIIPLNYYISKNNMIYPEKMFSLFAIRSWEQEKSAPSHEMLVRVCRLYQVSSDYLLGLSNIDPVYEQRRRLEQFSPEELTDLKKYESYLLWKKRSEKNKT